MAPRFEFTIAGTPWALSSPAPAPANRFQGWRADVRVVGARETVLGTGVPVVYEYRRDSLVTVTLRYLRPADVAVALRFKAHVESGGTAVLYAEDPGGLNFTVCMAEGGGVSLDGPDDVGEYSLTATLLWPDGDLAQQALYY